MSLFNKKSKPSQVFVPVKEVRDGIVMLKSGGMRAILMASSLNFALRSEDEQNAFIMQFQNFLNSLDFSVQISIQSRRLDIRPYIGTLEVRLKETIDELMRIQIREYIDFIKSFTEMANIMTKHFFVVVPYTPPSVTISKSGIMSKMPWSTSAPTLKEDFTFDENIAQLEQRISVVQQGLVRSGVRSVQLGTEESIELLYKIFNPGELDQPVQQFEAQQKASL
jgi:type IV secretory pathway VirB4 component